MKHLFCLTCNIILMAGIAWLGWLVWNGATSWLVVPITFLASMIFVPATEMYTCPNCGHVAKVKVFKTVTGSERVITEEK